MVGQLDGIQVQLRTRKVSRALAFTFSLTLSLPQSFVSEECINILVSLLILKLNDTITRLSRHRSHSCLIEPSHSSSQRVFDHRCPSILARLPSCHNASSAMYRTKQLSMYRVFRVKRTERAARQMLRHITGNLLLLIFCFHLHLLHLL